MDYKNLSIVLEFYREFFRIFSTLQFCSIIIIMLIYGCIRISPLNPSLFNFLLNAKKTLGEVIKLVESIRNSEMHEFLSSTNVSYSKWHQLFTTFLNWSFSYWYSWTSKFLVVYFEYSPKFIWSHVIVA